MNTEERYCSFAVEVEPIYTPGQGRSIDCLNNIVFNVYAKDIPDAMQKVRDLLRLDADKYDIISVIQQGHRIIRPGKAGY